jgi:hypothetical protein
MPLGHTLENMAADTAADTLATETGRGHHKGTKGK